MNRQGGKVGRETKKYKRAGAARKRSNRMELSDRLAQIAYCQIRKFRHTRGSSMIFFASKQSPGIFWTKIRFAYSNEIRQKAFAAVARERETLFQFVRRKAESVGLSQSTSCVRNRCRDRENSPIYSLLSRIANMCSTFSYFFSDCSLIRIRQLYRLFIALFYGDTAQIRREGDRQSREKKKKKKKPRFSNSVARNASRRPILRITFDSSLVS